MRKSWELPEDQKKEIQERSREIGAQYDPETGRKKGETENTGDSDDPEQLERTRRSQRDDEDIR